MCDCLTDILNEYSISKLQRRSPPRWTSLTLCSTPPSDDGASVDQEWEDFLKG